MLRGDTMRICEDAQEGCVCDKSYLSFLIKIQLDGVDRTSILMRSIKALRS